MSRSAQCPCLPEGSDFQEIQSLIRPFGRPSPGGRRPRDQVSDELNIAAGAGRKGIRGYAMARYELGQIEVPVST